MTEAAIKSGRSGERRLLSGKEEIRAAVINATSNASRALAILTPDLEPEIYDQHDFLDVLKRFILARSFARVRVLITQPSRSLKMGNEFVAMADRLNSYIEFRHLKREIGERHDAFFIADEKAIVYRAHHENWEGMCDPCEPAVARYYLDAFDELWHACASEAEQRRKMF
ncbi:MAG: hypothetical protein PVF63_00675 [Gammaproteobacteria bacterium]|jgi:hypothetical protein